MNCPKSIPSPKFVPLVNFCGYCYYLLPRLWNISYFPIECWQSHGKEILSFSTLFLNNSLRKELVLVQFQNVIVMHQSTLVSIEWLMFVNWSTFVTFKLSMSCEIHHLSRSGQHVFKTSCLKVVPLNSTITFSSKSDQFKKSNREVPVM